jgi:hypothetical protein
MINLRLQKIEIIIINKITKSNDKIISSPNKKNDKILMVKIVRI